MPPQERKAKDRPGREGRRRGPVSVEVLAGVHPVLEALRAGRPVNRLFMAHSAHRAEVEEIVRLARDKKVPVNWVDRERLNHITGGIYHQGVAAQVAPKPYLELDDLLEVELSPGENLFLLALDQIEDPHNLGAILRTAEAAGVHGVMIPTRRAAPATTAVARASAGALEHVRLARVGNLAQALDKCKQAGLMVLGLAGEAPVSLFSMSLQEPLVLVVGGEEQGMRRLIRERCDFIASLPMCGQVHSLNASVACAVACYEILRQRSLTQ